MAFTCGFYNSVNHDRKYDAVQHGMIFDGIITDGIYATYLKAMVVKASSNPSEVIVQPGRAWFNHTWSYNDADYPVAAPDPEVVLDRIDTLVLDINSEDAVRDNQFLWVQGTPTSQVPEPPELIHTATHNQYPLCDVYRQAGTTQIYAADITNRVGTSDCPFVTGVLEGINIDDLLAQWDDEFHTWENATKASFEGWMLNQQAVYSAWWDSLKTQMAGDVADVEEWVQTIKDIIDEETATHLQLEIDEINSMLPSGSHITVTTADTELYSRAVTITDEDDNTVTSQFDATGVAVFKSVPYVGNLTIEATDGIRTATAVVNTPYFARYEFPLAFWSATVNITGDTELGGETVTITDSSQILVGTVVLNASGAGVFNATYPDTYKFSVTHGGQTMEVSLAVTQETTYNVTIHAGFNWRGWVDTAKYLDSSDYDSLEEVLADELAVRELCLEHTCVDYLAAVPSVNTDIETVINNDLFAKWANNSDYSLDTLGANVAIKALMDEADKYGYGEWVLVGQVPKMTSNTAPYGTVSASSYYDSGYLPYYAFDGDDTKYWYSTNLATNNYLQYEFVTAIKPSKVSVLMTIGPASGKTVPSRTFVVKGSNDGFVSDSHDLGSFTTDATTSSITETFTANIDDGNTYKYLRLFCADTVFSNGNFSFGIRGIQFYAWAPKGNVPVMTSDTAPYGVINGDAAFSSSYLQYMAFDDNPSTMFIANNRTLDTTFLRYKFVNPVKVRRTKLVSANGSIGKLELRASNDGFATYDVIGTIDNGNGHYNEIVEEYDDFDNDNYYLEYGVALKSYGTTDIGNNKAIITLQFYGRELSVSVPVMTGNTTPYGEASASNTYDTYYPWKAFDGTNGNGWFAYAQGEWVEYDFQKPIKVEMITYGGKGAGTKAVTTYPKFQGYDGTNWNNLTNEIEFTIPTATTVLGKVASMITSGVYQKYRMILSSESSNHDGNGFKVQFYGKDYSEKEFEEGTNKKWLYDHGLELETLNDWNYNAAGSVTRTPQSIVLNDASSSGTPVIDVHMDLTDYSLVRVRAGGIYTSGYAVIYSQYEDFSHTIGGYSLFTDPPHGINFPIDSVNGLLYLWISNYSNTTVGNMEITEWWLE